MGLCVCASCIKQEVGCVGQCACAGERKLNHVNEIQNYTVLGSFLFPKRPATRAGRVILVDRGVKYPHRYVTTILFEDDLEWWQGHYFATFNEALEKYFLLIEKWA